MDMSPKIRDSVGMKNNTPQTIKQISKKRSIEQVDGFSAVEDSLCPGLNGKEVTIRTNFTMTVKEPVKPYGLKIELVISDIDFGKNQAEKRGIMNYVEALGKNFFSKPDYAGGPLKCYPEKGNMVITSKVGMPFDVKALHYIFSNAVGKKLKYDSTFPSIDAALENAKPWYNKGEYMIDEEEGCILVFDIKGLYPLTAKAREDLKHCSPVFIGGNCWKYSNPEEVLKWFKNSKKCLFEKREKGAGEVQPLVVPDDF